jgi:enoyl-[acyl-carrier protein] reductase II
MAGQTVGLVNKILPVRGIIEEFVTDAEAEMQRLKEIFDVRASSG